MGRDKEGKKTKDKMKREAYEEQLSKLQVEPVNLQEWVKLLKRQERGNYREPDYPYKFVPKTY